MQDQGYDQQQQYYQQQQLYDQQQYNQAPGGVATPSHNQGYQYDQHQFQRGNTP